MPNTIGFQDWLKILDKEYLSSFIKDGGSSIKFAVTPDELKGPLYSEMRNLCQKLNYMFVELDAATIRVHMPQDIFFDLASQVDWRLSARRLVLRVAQERKFKIEGVDPTVSNNIFATIAKINGVSPLFFFTSIIPRIQDLVFKDSGMARDFRVGMSHLCMNEDVGDGDEYGAQPILDWLTDAKTKVSSTRPFAIYTKINRTTARYFLQSSVRWVRTAGYAGTVILIDNSRVTLAKNPKDGYKYYTKTMTLDHYELLRELVDDIDRLEGTLLVVAASHQFLDDSAGGRGYGIYPALHTRVMDDVHDKNLVNPVASLVRLS